MQVLSTLVQVANTTYFEAADAQLQLNNYTSCSSAPESLQSTPPPPAAPPPPSNIGAPLCQGSMMAETGAASRLWSTVAIHFTQEQSISCYAQAISYSGT